MGRGWDRDPWSLCTLMWSLYRWGEPAIAIPAPKRAALDTQGILSIPRKASTVDLCWVLPSCCLSSSSVTSTFVFIQGSVPPPPPPHHYLCMQLFGSCQSKCPTFSWLTGRYRTQSGPVSSLLGIWIWSRVKALWKPHPFLLLPGSPRCQSSLHSCGSPIAWF